MKREKSQNGLVSAVMRPKLESIEEGGEQKFGLEVTTGGTTRHASRLFDWLLECTAAVSMPPMKRLGNLANYLSAPTSPPTSGGFCQTWTWMHRLIGGLRSHYFGE